jgi:hypothetical protein
LLTAEELTGATTPTLLDLTATSTDDKPKDDDGDAANRTAQTNSNEQADTPLPAPLLRTTTDTSQTPPSVMPIVDGTNSKAVLLKPTPIQATSTSTPAITPPTPTNTAAAAAAAAAAGNGKRAPFKTSDESFSSKKDGKGKGKLKTSVGSGSCSVLSGTGSNKSNNNVSTSAEEVSRRDPKHKLGGAASAGSADDGNRWREPTMTVTTDRRGNRVLLLSDVKGQISLLNTVAISAKVSYVICTGNFGFFDASSASTIDAGALPKAAPSKTHGSKAPGGRQDVGELPLCIEGKLKLKVPVYTIWGDQEDVRVLCKFRRGEYTVPNLHIIDELNSHANDGLRLLGLGGAIDVTKMVDGGSEGDGTIAGEGGRMWTTLLQIGQLIKTSKQTYRQGETRMFITFGNPLLEGFLTILAHELKADIVLFHQSSSFGVVSLRENVVNSMDTMARRMKEAAGSVRRVWDEVGREVTELLRDAGMIEYLELIDAALGVLKTEPSPYHHSNVWHIGAAPLSSVYPRSKSVLTTNGASNSQFGLDMTCSGADLQRQRSYSTRTRGTFTSSRPLQSSSATSEAAEHRAKVAVVGGKGWSRIPTVVEVRELFAGSSISWIYLPRDVAGDITIHFASATDLHRSLNSDVRVFAESSFKVVQLPAVHVATDRSQGRGNTRGKGGGGSSRSIRKGT